MTPHNTSQDSQFRLGILGGMGPAAGVLLQKLIVDRTPVARDQDHIEVICFTNPHITDRTWSLNHDGGVSYLRDVVKSLQLLERAEATHLVITCNTAYVRYAEMVPHLSRPLIHMVDLTKEYLARSPAATGLLGTDWTVRSRIYSGSDDAPFPWCALPADLQAGVMEAIYLIKAGDVEKESITKKLFTAIDFFASQGVARIVLGCTELSLYYDVFTARYPDVVFVDPLRVVAEHVVATALSSGGFA